MDLGNNAIYNDEEITIIEDSKYENETLNQINTTESIIELEEPLRTLEIEGNIVYDEIVIENNVAYIYRNIGLDENGNLVQLNSTVVELYGELPINTYDGNTYIHIKDIDELEYMATYIEENPFTNKFMLQLEGRTNFKINSEQIASKVSKDEMNSVIDQKAYEINIEVGKKYNTSDFTNAKITAKLNDGTSSILIKADKVDLTAIDILNILSGNILNLTSKNITISSDNFSVNKNGDMECKDAKMSDVQITGGELVLTSDDNTRPSIKIISPDNENNYIEINSAGVYMYYNGIVRTKIIRMGWVQLYDANGNSGVNITSDGIYAGSVPIYGSNIKKMDCGEVSITPSAESTPTGKAITFSSSDTSSTTFTEVPIVVTTPKSTVVGTKILGTGVSGIDETGCTIYVTRTNTTNTIVEWIAIQQ